MDVFTVVCQVTGTIELGGSVLRLFGDSPSRHAALPELVSWDREQGLLPRLVMVCRLEPGGIPAVERLSCSNTRYDGAGSGDIAEESIGRSSQCFESRGLRIASTAVTLGAVSSVGLIGVCSLCDIAFVSAIGSLNIHRTKRSDCAGVW